MKKHLTKFLLFSGSLLLCLLLSTTPSFAQDPDPGGTYESTLDDGRFRADKPNNTKPVEGAEKTLSSTYTFQGRGNWSLDAVGSNETPVGTIQAEVPPGSFVEQAFLYSTMYIINTAPTVVFEGVTYSGSDWVSIGQPTNFLEAYRTDVTTQIRSLVGSGSASTFNFSIDSEVPNVEIDGEALVIVYSNPAEDGRQIIIYDGAASPSGDNTVINFPSAIPSVSSPNFEATLSLGIGFSCCGQTSEVDVNGNRLTSTAGNKDDGLTSTFNGTLITMGGIGDSRSNPAPFSGDYEEDDELYDIGSFLSDGDASLTLNSRNPTNDDIIFFMGVNIASEVFNPCDEGDVAGPSVTCPGDQEVACGSTLLDYAATATATDNCDETLTITQTPAPGTIVNGNITVTLSAVDDSGNTGSCSFNVGPPAIGITCPGDQQSCDEVLADYTNVATSGFCGGNIIVTQTPPAGSNITGPLTVTLTAMDDTGNSASCSFNVGPPADADMDGYTQCEGDCDDNDPTVYPNAPELCDGKDNDCDGQLESSTSYLIPSSDLVNLSGGCSGTRLYSGSSIIGFSWTSTNNQTPTSVSVEFQIGVDCNSNGTTRTTTLNGQAQPSFTTIRNCSCNNNNTYQVTLVLDPADYVSGGMNTFLISNSSGAFGFQDFGNNVFAKVCVEYSDEAGSCEVDSTPPTITCPADMDINCGDPTTVAALGNATATDDCDDTPTITHTDELNLVCDGVGVLYRTFVATDAAGNSAACTQTINILAMCDMVTVDAGPDQVLCSDPIELTATAVIGACVEVDTDETYLWSPGGQTTPSITVTEAGTYTVMISTCHGCTASDVVVVSNETTPPSISCPGTQTKTADGNCEATLSDYTGLTSASDECDDNPTVTQSPAPGTTIYGNTTVTLIATDASGNSTSCTFMVVLDDIFVPSLTCPGTQTVNLDANCSASMPDYTGQASVSDNCDNNPTVTQSPMPGSPISGTGNTTVTLVATDASGNSTSCSFTVTALDVTPPSITCPSNFSIGNDEGSCDAFVTFPIPQWDDNCSRSSLHYRYRTVDVNDNPTSAWSDWFTGFNTGTFAVGKWEFEWRAADAVPNYNYCEYYMEVLDTEAPDPVCLDPVVYLEPNGTYTLQNADVLDLVNTDDNCSTVAVTNISPAVVDCDDFDLDIPVTVTVTDDAGNTAQCVAMVNVQKGTALPEGWGNTSIGGATGNAEYDPCEEVYCVESNGISFPLEDKVHMAYQYLCASPNMDIIARVVSVSDIHGFGGIMIRESLDAGAKKVALKTQLNGTFYVQRDVRTVTDGFSTSNQVFRPGVNWLRIVRTGNQFIMYTRTDNTSWQFIGFAIVQMNSCVYIGLFAEGDNDVDITTACFDNVSITGGSAEPIVDGGNNWNAETTRATEFSVFPNPATNEVNIDLSQFEDNTFTMKVYNNMGQLVFRKEYQYLENYLEQLDISQYQDGIYLINVELEDGTLLSKKLVVYKK